MDYISSFTSLSTDTIILLAGFALIFISTLKLGASRIAALIISIYIAGFIYTNAFFIESLTILGGSPVKEFANSLAIFLVILIPVFIVVERMVLSDLGGGGKRFIKAGLLSIALLGLILVTLYHVVPLGDVYDFSNTLDKIFASDTALTAWLIIPLLILFF